MKQFIILGKRGATAPHRIQIVYRRMFELNNSRNCSSVDEVQLELNCALNIILYIYIDNIEKALIIDTSILEFQTLRYRVSGYGKSTGRVATLCILY